MTNTTTIILQPPVHHENEYGPGGCPRKEWYDSLEYAEERVEAAWSEALYLEERTTRKHERDTLQSNTPRRGRQCR